jgi:seryl-tRNA synthetase
MLDIAFIRANPDLVAKGAAAKNVKIDLPHLLEVDQTLRTLQTQWENAQATRNQLSRDIAVCAPQAREALKDQVRELKTNLEEMQARLRDLRAEFHTLMLQVPQPARQDVPQGKSDAENVEVRTWGTPPAASTTPLDHIQLGEKLGIIDFERAVKLAGSRSYVLKGDGARLEQAVHRFTFDYLVSKGFTAMSVPVLVNEMAMEGTGYFPLGRDQAYLAERDKLALVGTSEVALCSFHADEILDGPLPRRYMAQSACFRREAGSYGRDTKGLYRVHQFQKIEMVILAPADEALTDQLHAELLGHAEYVLQALGLPYRVVYVCTGDLGQGQVRKHDLETWMPSRGGYGETHSCSSFYDFQSRRLQIRYTDEAGKKRFVYTLNNTACATPRLLLPLLENFQNPDGSVRIPECLQPYMGGQKVLTA